MSGKFTHYLITRFNVPVKNWDKDKAGRPTLDAAWMQERIELFRTYCVPSIASQDQKDFTWIVYCDSESPDDALQIIQQEVGHVQGAHVRLAMDFDALLVDLRALLAEAATPYVMTSRLDNDDGLGRHAIQLIQSHFVAEHQVIINLTGGVLYDIRQKILTELRHTALNHYGSLIEYVNPGLACRTVLGFPHHQPPPDFRVVDVPCRRAWLKIIHDRNLKSRTAGIPLFRRNMYDDFGIDPKAFSLSYRAMTRYLWQKVWSKVRRKVSSATS